MSTDTKSGFAHLAGGRLYYEVAGSGEPLVLLHGFTLDHRMWDGQLDAFARHHMVVRYDLRGFGLSDPPSVPYWHADDLKALLTHLGIERATIVGLSMGGGVAIDFALEYPQATAALIAVDAAVGGFPWPAEGNALYSAIRRLAREEGVDAARSMWLQHPLFKPAHEQPGVARQLQDIVSRYSGWHWLNNDPGAARGAPAYARLEEVAAPMLVIYGEREVPEFREASEAVAARVTGAHKVVLPGVGHMSNMEAPGLFNEAVLNFLRRELPQARVRGSR